MRRLRYGLQLHLLPEAGQHAGAIVQLEPEGPGILGWREVRRWIEAGYWREASGVDFRALRRAGRISPAFLTVSAMQSCIVIDYSLVNECLDESSFRMDHFADLSPSLRQDDFLFKTDIKDAYYHLRLLKSDQLYLKFLVGGTTYIPLFLNCCLSVAT